MESGKTVSLGNSLPLRPTLKSNSLNFFPLTGSMASSPTPLNRHLPSQRSGGRAKKSAPVSLPQVTSSRSKTPIAPRRPAQSPPRRGNTRVPQNLPLPRLRLLSVWVILALGIAGLSYRLYQLQVIQATTLQKKAQAQQTTTLSPYIPRRTIVDSLGNVLATDRLSYILYVHPKLFKEPPTEIAQALAQILDTQSPSAIAARFNEKPTGIKLATRLSEAQASKIKALGWDGLELEQQYARFYPQDEMASEIVGYVDGEHQGQAGLELSQRQLLERDALNVAVRRAGNGTLLPAFMPSEVLQSNDWQLQVTLDLRLQRAAREALQAQVKAQQAKRGTVIVMDSYDGSILALVNEPTFNPNQYYKAKVEYFKNWSVTDLYEPGSTFKPINVALGLNANAFKANTKIYDGGSVQVGPWTIKNAHGGGGGLIGVDYVIKTSSNVGMVALMRMLPPARFYELLQGLGLDSKTGIDLPGEVANYLKPKTEFTSQPIEVATTAFGQGLSITPIKLVQLHAALANGGKLVTPHVVQGLADARGTLHWQPDYPVKPVFSQKHAHDVVKMMGDVVNADGGTGKAAKINGYEIGGKTGTAQKAGPRGGYLPNAKIVSFIAVLPIENPRYVVLAVIDEPKGGNAYGGTVAAPIVKKVMEALIALKGIPPSNPAALDPLKPLTAKDDEPKKKN